MNWLLSYRRLYYTLKLEVSRIWSFWYNSESFPPDSETMPQVKWLECSPGDPKTGSGLCRNDSPDRGQLLGAASQGLPRSRKGVLALTSLMVSFTFKWKWRVVLVKCKDKVSKAITYKLSTSYLRHNDLVQVPGSVMLNSDICFRSQHLSHQISYLNVIVYVSM